MQSERKWILLSYVVVTLLASWVLGRALGIVVQIVQVRNPQVMGVLPATALIAVVVMGISGYLYFRQPKVESFSSEVLQEMKKVTWPPRRNTYVSTLVVLICVIIAAGILGVYDFVCTKIIGGILGI
jgi:preprotein translocase SecE subunit